MDFNVTSRLEKIDGNNFLIYDVTATAPFVAGPTNPIGVVNNYRMFCVDCAENSNGQLEYSHTVNLGEVTCGDPNDIGAGIDVCMSKSGGTTTKNSKGKYAQTSICP